MACPLNSTEIDKLKAFIAVCSTKPEILNIPQLDFFKKFVEQLGGAVPDGKFEMPPTFQPEPEKEKEKPAEPMTPEPETEDVEESETDPESEIELDMEGVIEGDNDDHQKMGDSEKEPSEEEMDEASDIRSKAASAYSEQKFQEAIDLYTKAIELNPGNALFYAKRGQAFLKLKKPNACIRDCTRALELNCDSAAAYKFMGRAHRLLGNWEDAAKNLRQACKLDFDEEADEWLREVTPNAKKIEQHRIKQERKKTERELKKRQERNRKAQEANKKAQEEEKKRQTTGGGRTGGMPNLGNLFGGMDQSELLSAFNDPEVSAALQDIMTNPENISKYQNNTKVMNLIAKLGSAMGGGGMPGGFPGGMPGGFPGGMPGGFPGGMPGGFPGGMPGGASTQPPPSSNNKKPDFTDDGLD